MDLFLKADGNCVTGLEWVDTSDENSVIVTLAPPAQSSEFHSVSIQLDQGQEPINSLGGKVKYDATIQNLDITENTFIQWSVLTLPTGEDYSIHKATSYTVAATDTREFTRTRITIPDWFPAGEYSFSWYLADKDNTDKIIVRDTLKFNKLDN
jgi:hypothetical protein